MNNGDIYSKKLSLGLIPHELTESNSLKETVKDKQGLRIPQWILFSAMKLATKNSPKNCQKKEMAKHHLYTFGAMNEYGKFGLEPYGWMSPAWRPMLKYYSFSQLLAFALIVSSVLTDKLNISICRLSLLIISIRVHLKSLMSMIMWQYTLHMGAIMKQLISVLLISDHNWYLTTRMSCLFNLFKGAKCTRQVHVVTKSLVHYVWKLLSWNPNK